MACNCPPWPEITPLSVQPIYPFTIDPVPYKRAECIFRLEPMHAAVFRFRLNTGRSTPVGVVHTAPITIQDRSIRVWISTLPLGQSVISAPTSFFDWEANRVPKQHFVAYDEASEKPTTQVPTLAVPAGVLYLNVINLVNSLNEFALRLTRCACDDTP